MPEAIACSGSCRCKILAQDHFLSASIFDGASNNRLVLLLCLFQPDTVQCCGAYGGLKRAAPPFLLPPFFFWLRPNSFTQAERSAALTAFYFLRAFSTRPRLPCGARLPLHSGRRVHFVHLPFVWPEPLGLGEGGGIDKSKAFCHKKNRRGQWKAICVIPQAVSL